MSLTLTIHISGGLNDQILTIYELLSSINDQVKKDWDIPDECTDEVIMFDVVKETLRRFSKLTVEKVTKDD